MSLDFAPYDQRKYVTRSVQDAYGEWAQIYDDGALDQFDLEAIDDFEAIPWTEVGRAIDLACGTGRIGAYLKKRGVEVVDGIDLTPQMVERARDKGLYRRLELGDMTATPFDAGAYDLVTNSLAVEHLPEVEPLYREAARLAAADACFLIVGYHPHFLLNGIPTHFRDADGCNVAITNRIHLLADHVRAARATGWRLDELEERIVDADWVERFPSYERHRGRPVTFIAVWRRQSPRPP